VRQWRSVGSVMVVDSERGVRSVMFAVLLEWRSYERGDVGGRRCICCWRCWHKMRRVAKVKAKKEMMTMGNALLVPIHGRPTPHPCHTPKSLAYPIFKDPFCNIFATRIDNSPPTNPTTMPPKPRATRAARAAPAADVAEATPAPTTTILASPVDKPHFHPAPADYSSGEDRVPQGAEYSESEPSEEEDGGYDSEEDPVVKEYDIYMTSELASSLYLFQYPVRAVNKPYTKAQHSCPVDARLKSKAGLIEIDVPVNTAQNFDQEKGKVWGDALHQQVKAKEGGIAGKAAMGSKAGGKRRKVKDESDDEEETDTMLMDFQEALKKGRVFNKQTLGSKIQSDEARYMVGVFRDGMLLKLQFNIARAMC
jgi:hypothetical protein